MENYQPKYKNQILQLFEKTFNSKMTEEFWEWRFEKNPFGRTLIKLGFVNQHIVANYLLHSTDLRFQGKSYQALYSMTTMTDPEYSGRGIMTKLASSVYELSRNEGCQFVWGIANKNSRNMFTKKLGFKELSVMNEFGIEKPQDHTFECHCNLLPIQIFDDSFTDFFEKINNKLCKIIIPRTSKYLNWRFFEHPENKYHCYKITQNGHLAGYFVLKKYQNKCHIVDFLTEDNEDFYNGIIKQAISFCNHNKLDKLTLWSNRNLDFFKYLQKNGFSEYPMENYFIIKTLSNAEGFKEILNFNNWYTTMSDSDVF